MTASLVERIGAFRESDQPSSTIRLAVLALFLAFPPGTVSARPLTAEEILNRTDDLFRGESSHAEMTMKITTAHWSRELSLESWSKGTDLSLIRILEPKKERGTATLRSGNDIWNFLPKIKRVIKIPSSMMSASWMGSHYTNDDLVKESRMAEDYTFEITFEGMRDGREIVEILCIPKPDAAVVWGKVLVIVRSDDYLPLGIDYYDEDLHLSRTLTFSDFQDFGGRVVPATMIVVPPDKPGESTLVRYDELAFDIQLTEDFFSLRNLQR